jgi:hypothetical protein
MSTTIENPGASNRFAAVMLRAHVRMLAAGMRNSQLSGTAILRKVTEVTGNRYKRGQYQAALADLNAMLDA